MTEYCNLIGAQDSCAVHKPMLTLFPDPLSLQSGSGNETTREQSGEVGLPRLTLTHLEPPMTCPAVPAPAPAGGPILPPMVGRLSSLRLVNAPSHWGSPSVGSVLFPDRSSWVATLDARIRWHTLWLYDCFVPLKMSYCACAVYFVLMPHPSCLVCYTAAIPPC